MEFIYEKKIEYGMCDINALLKIPEIFKMVESGAASFFGLYQKDNLTLRKVYGALWLFTKTSVHIEKLPVWNEMVSIEACLAGEPSKVTCVVEVFIHTKNSKQGIRAWVECCSASIETRKLLRLSAIDFEIPFESSSPEYSKWEEELEQFKTLTVSSSYIDYSRHVNNAEYIRILFDGYSIEELEQMHIKNIEVHYLAEAKEKDMLTIFSKKIEKTTYFQIYRDKLILEMKMEEE